MTLSSRTRLFVTFLLRFFFLFLDDLFVAPFGSINEWCGEDFGLFFLVLKTFLGKHYCDNSTMTGLVEYKRDEGGILKQNFCSKKK